ncbi:unnamed protein product [Lota lota]
MRVSCACETVYDDSADPTHPWRGTRMHPKSHPITSFPTPHTHTPKLPSETDPPFNADLIPLRHVGSPEVVRRVDPCLTVTPLHQLPSVASFNGMITPPPPPPPPPFPPLRGCRACRVSPLVNSSVTFV